MVKIFFLPSLFIHCESDRRSYIRFLDQYCYKRKNFIRMIGICKICKKKNFIIIFLSVVHPEWNWRITLLSALFEHCTYKWINIVQLLSCFDGSSYSRYLLAVRCIDASLILLFPRITLFPILEERWKCQSTLHAKYLSVFR